MVKLRVGSSGWAVFHCPGCECGHRFLVRPNPQYADKPVWRWNGSEDSPTLTPSLNYVGVCHSFVTDGKIQFLGDSTHKLAGQTGEIPDWEES